MPTRIRAYRPVRMTNAAKATQWDVIWTPWGAPHTITGAPSLDARFPGQWFQLEAGLHYNWHRHYDPSLGRYTQPDPLGFADGPSVYAYGLSNPVSLVDLKGLFTDESGKKWKVPEDIPPLPADCPTAYVFTQFFCKMPHRCYKTDTCATLERKQQWAMNCIMSQKQVNICYGDDENDPHGGERFKSEDNAIQRCIDWRKKKNCYVCPSP